MTLVPVDVLAKDGTLRGTSARFSHPVIHNYSITGALTLLLRPTASRL
jgi:hypothetical protein